MPRSLNSAKLGVPRLRRPAHVVDDYADVAQSTGPSWTASDISLFEPLRRRSGADSQGEHESLGLGLFIVSQFALAHGGGVTAESAEGRTRFTLRLPKR